MKPGKQRKKSKPRPTESVTRIEEVLAKVGKRVELASALGVSESRISEYIAGKRKPLPETWLKLGKLALKHGLPDPFYFWAQAGHDLGTFQSMGAKVFEAQYSSMGEIVPIPRFRQTEQGREEAGPPLPLPTECIPNPRATICLSLSEKSTGVVDAPKGLFILDTSVESTESLRELWNRVLMIYFDRPEWAPRFPRGVYVGRLIEMMPVQRGHQSEQVDVSAALLSLTGNEVYERMFIGSYEETDGLHGISPQDPEARRRRMSEIGERALSKLRLDKGIRILGRVIGRLTGHLE